MARVFISYRRSDAPDHARRLALALRRSLGPRAVFIDVEGLSAGDKLQEAIDRELLRANCVLAVIGKTWLHSITTADRISADYVRHEIELALERGIPLLPVLVDGALMPTQGELPTPLMGLSHRLSKDIIDETWDRDVTDLAETIRTLPRSRWPYWRYICAAIMLLLAAGILASLQPVARWVREWRGRPVHEKASGATTAVPPPMPKPKVVTLARAVTDAAGQFRLRSMAPGSYRVTFTDGHDSRVLENVVVAQRSGIRLLHVAMSDEAPIPKVINEKVGTISGSVVSSDGSPRRGVKVLAAQMK